MQCNKWSVTMKRRLLLLCLTLNFCESECYRILGVFPLPSKSHMIMFESLMKGLAARGHEVDVVGHFPLEHPIPRYNDISIRGTLPIMTNNFSVSQMNYIWGTYYHRVRNIVDNYGTIMCRDIFNSTIGKSLLKTVKKYDLVIIQLFSTDCMLGFGHYFKVPVVGVSSSTSLPWANERIGNPDNPSYIPNFFVPYLSKMNLKERVLNALVQMETKLGFLMSNEEINTIAREYFGSDLPDLRELAYNTSLILVNSHFSITGSRPLVPNFIEVGGLHITTPKPIGKYLKDFFTIKPPYKGVIYLSMGSLMRSETFALYKLQAIFEGLRTLPYKVLWKGNKNKYPSTLSIPKNIHFEPWLSQLDILCHPSLKLFMSHGGLLGIQESVYCAVPILGMPLFGDQEGNLRRIADLGVAKVLTYDSITKENIFANVKELLEDSRYKTNMVKISKLFRDRPISALDTAIYWVEYVIRYNGAPNLRSRGADLPLYQYLLLDIAAILFAILLALVMCVYYIISVILRRIFNNKKTNKSKKE